MKRAWYIPCPALPTKYLKEARWGGLKLRKEFNRQEQRNGSHSARRDVVRTSSTPASLAPATLGPLTAVRQVQMFPRSGDPKAGRPQSCDSQNRRVGIHRKRVSCSWIFVLIRTGTSWPAIWHPPQSITHAATHNVCTSSPLARIVRCIRQ